MEEERMRGIFGSIALILCMLLAWSLLPEAEGQRKQEEPVFIILQEGEIDPAVITTFEDLERELVEETPEAYLNDMTWADHAKEVLETKNIYVVTGTVYNAVKSQCYGNPLVTADGSKIDKTKLENGEIKWIAVSQDLLNRGLSYGDRVEVRNIDNPEYTGIFEIHDTMNSRFTSYIDFLVPDHVKVGKWTNVIIEKIKE